MTVTIAMAATRVLLIAMLMPICFNGRKDEIPHRGMYAMPPLTTCDSKINKTILHIKTTTGSVCDQLNKREYNDDHRESEDDHQHDIEAVCACTRYDKDDDYNSDDDYHYDSDHGTGDNKDGDSYDGLVLSIVRLGH